MQTQLSLVRLLRQRVPAGGMFSGRTAAWLHGLDLLPCDPVEVTLPRLSPTSKVVGVSLTRSDVPAAEACIVRTLPATSAARTVADLGRRLPEVEAVVVIDMALHRRLVETRLRLLLISNRLPKPILQPFLEDDTGWFIAKPDLYYPTARLVIEYDGGTHRDSFAADNRRQNRLLEAGYRLLRFTAGDILRTPASVVGQVERALAYSIGSPN